MTLFLRATTLLCLSLSFYGCSFDERIVSDDS
ncbi:hypothetical protein MNBD_GAMMA07-66, partial [hydrothermal vent metagenome]